MLIKYLVLALVFLTPLQVSSVDEAPKEEVLIEEKVTTWEEVFALFPADLQATSLCESDIDGDGLPNPEAENPHSTASGVLQFLDGTFAWVWSETRSEPVDWSKKNDPLIQMEFGLWLYERYHLTHWQYPCGTLHA